MLEKLLIGIDQVKREAHRFVDVQSFLGNGCLVKGLFWRKNMDF